MLFIKTAHIFFVMAWMAGIFYLPRILVHYREGIQTGEDVRRLLIMGVKLFRFSIFTGSVAILLGLVLMLGFGITGGWLHLKILLVILLIVYQYLCGKEFKKISLDKPLYSSKFYRIFNEVSLVIIVPIIYLVVAKPF